MVGKRQSLAHPPPSLVSSEPRAGNRALEYLRAHYSAEPDLRDLVESLPMFGFVLRNDAKRQASDIWHELAGPGLRLLGRISGKRKLLTNCVIDLMLTSCFSQILESRKDRELASLLADAAVYEITGYEAGKATESQVLDEGTQKVRGLSKYALGRKILQVGDVEGWVFGKECAALLSGRSKDIAHIMTVQPYAVRIRGVGELVARYWIYGIEVTEADLEKVSQRFVSAREELWRAIDGSHDT